MRRIVLLVMDSVGIGEQPDAADYNSIGANTFYHAAQAYQDFSIPNLQMLGIGNIIGVDSVPAVDMPRAHYGRMTEVTSGNDTFAGIWEMGGVIFKGRFESYNPKIPEDTIKALQQYIGIPTLCNAYISGFLVYDIFVDEHFATGYPIVYTNDDGVILIAAHEEVIIPSDLHRIARRTAEFFTDKKITRIIARPFVGNKGNFVRTANRLDIAIPLDKGQVHLYSLLQANNVNLVVTEHLSSIIGQQFPTRIFPGIKNSAGIMELVNAWLDMDEPGVSMFVVPDFDMSGHKKDPQAYGNDLVKFDTLLGQILPKIGSEDLLLITADHGCDPSLNIRGHTREYVPLLVFSGGRQTGSNLGTRTTFADIGATICELVGAGRIPIGTSFAQNIKELT